MEQVAVIPLYLPGTRTAGLGTSPMSGSDWQHPLVHLVLTVRTLQLRAMIMILSMSTLQCCQGWWEAIVNESVCVCVCVCVCHTTYVTALVKISLGQLHIIRDSQRGVLRRAFSMTLLVQDLQNGAEQNGERNRRDTEGRQESKENSVLEGCVLDSNPY